MEFPRLVLPPVPRIGRRDQVAPLLDEPASTWQAPHPPRLRAEDRHRAMAERVALLGEPGGATHASDVVDGHGATDAPDPVDVPPMPELEPAPEPVAARTSTLAIVLLVGCAALLAWASRMAFSPALLAVSALLVAQLAACAAAASPRGGRRPFILGVLALLLAALAAKGALRGFSDEAFVAGLFVIAASVPAAVLLGVAQVVLHRRREGAPAADVVLRTGWKLRAGALLATLLAGVQAHRTFSALPDALVTLVIVALVALVALQALRRQGDGAAPA